MPRPEIPVPLADSWRRSMALGISPDQHGPRRLHDPSEVLQLRREHRLQQVMPALQDLLADDSSSGRNLLVLTDANGKILWRVGSREALRRADRLEFSERADWAEAGIGTNAISEAHWSPARRGSRFPPSTWSAPATTGPAGRRPSRVRPPAGCWECSMSQDR